MVFAIVSNALEMYVVLLIQDASLWGFSSPIEWGMPSKDSHLIPSSSGLSIWGKHLVKLGTNTW